MRIAAGLLTTTVSHSLRVLPSSPHHASATAGAACPQRARDDALTPAVPKGREVVSCPPYRKARPPVIAVFRFKIGLLTVLAASALIGLARGLAFGVHP